MQCDTDSIAAVYRSPAIAIIDSLIAKSPLSLISNTIQWAGQPKKIPFPLGDFDPI